MDLFETRGTVGEETFKELKKHLMPRNQKLSLGVFIVLGAGAFVFAAIVRNYSLMIIAALAVLLFSVEYTLLLNKYVKVNMKRLRETAHADEYATTTALSDEGITVKNHATNTAAMLSYDDFVRFAETDTLYALFTGANQCCIMHKASIDGAGNREQFLGALKERCKNVKWQGK